MGGVNVLVYNVTREYGVGRVGEYSVGLSEFSEFWVEAWLSWLFLPKSSSLIISCRNAEEDLKVMESKWDKSSQCDEVAKNYYCTRYINRIWFLRTGK